MQETYDLSREGQVVQQQRSHDVDPIAEARHMMSSAILCHVLLGLSDAGFYEYLATRKRFSVSDAIAALSLDAFAFRALVDYLLGCGAFNVDPADADTLTVTSKGARLFNVYTRGVTNVYLGGYGKVLQAIGQVLTGSKLLSDPDLARSTTHAAAGTAYSTCVFTIPTVLAAIESRKPTACLDLGCGTGDFLIRFAIENPHARGIGIDVSAEALARARARATAWGVADRLEFHEAEIGARPLALPTCALRDVDIVTAMYMLHEFGRAGQDRIVDVVKSIVQSVPNCTLVALEVEGCDPVSLSEGTAPSHYGRLDYRLIHALSGQGLPRSQHDWHEIFRKAGMAVVEPGIRTGGSLIYIAQADNNAQI